jgi:glutathione peroxidase
MNMSSDRGRLSRRPLRSSIRLAVAAMLSAVALTGCAREAPVTEELVMKWEGSSLYDIDVATLEGEPVSLGAYRGRVTLVVNTASKCGFTPQYEGLQELHERYGDRGFEVLGFPSGDFMGQEFGTADEIREFCTSQYQVTFPMFAKVGVKPGDDQSPVFEYLGTEIGELPAWNFGKYVIDRNGRPVAYFGSRTTPTDPKVIAAIEAALAADDPAPASADAGG